MRDPMAHVSIATSRALHFHLAKLITDRSLCACHPIILLILFSIIITSIISCLAADIIRIYRPLVLVTTPRHSSRPSDSS